MIRHENLNDGDVATVLVPGDLEVGGLEALLSRAPVLTFAEQVETAEHLLLQKLVQYWIVSVEERGGALARLLTRSVDLVAARDALRALQAPGYPL